MTRNTKFVAFAIAALALIALPLVAQQFGTGLGAHHGARAALCAARAGPEHRRRLRRPARPRLRGLLRRGRVHVRAAELAAPHRHVREHRGDVPERAALADLDRRAARRGAGGHRRRAARHAGAQAARRLPRDRHARIRRDHPRVPEQHGAPAEHHERAARARPHRLDAPVQLQLRQVDRHRRVPHLVGHAVLLALPRRSWCSAWSSATASRHRASGARGWRSARTRSPPRRWASTRAT